MTKKEIDKKSTNWFKPKEWSVRDNEVRKKGQSVRGSHPSLVVGENKKKFANLGITHDKQRGHHSNIPLKANPNPKDKKQAYIRTDVEFHNKNKLKKTLPYKISKADVPTVMKIINKKK